MLTANPALAQYEEDTKTVTSTIEALYEVISGPAGQERDWDRFNNLFYAGANLIPVGVTPDSVFVNILTYDQYEAVAGQWLVDNGFFEIELSRTEERYGHIVHGADRQCAKPSLSRLPLLSDGSYCLPPEASPMAASHI